MKIKLMMSCATVCLAGFIAACGSPSPTVPPPTPPLITIESFNVSQGLVQQGSDFRLNWSISSGVPAVGSLYLSHSPDQKKDAESRHVISLTCGSYTACEWNGELLCSINPDRELSCVDPNTEKTSTAIKVDRFIGDVYLVLEACAAFECETASRKITIQ